MGVIVAVGESRERERERERESERVKGRGVARDCEERKDGMREEEVKEV